MVTLATVGSHSWSGQLMRPATVEKPMSAHCERIAAEESCYCGDSTQSFCFVTRRLSVDFVSRHLQATISILILSFPWLGISRHYSSGITVEWVLTAAAIAVVESHC